MTLSRAEILAATDRLVCRLGVGETPSEMEALADDTERQSGRCADPELAMAVALELRRRALALLNEG